MDELPLSHTRILPGFWHDRLQVNASQALDHQWQQLERTLCLDNFRLAAGLKDGFREGFFFADSDAYKWLEAAAWHRMLPFPSPHLSVRVDEFIAILEQAQQPDGYLYTYNQLHFPHRRWANLQIEHELYCFGHLIEAGVADYLATGQTRLLQISRRAADLLVRDFWEASPQMTDGHEEIEIALIRLHRATGEPAYLELARRFLERRGQIPGYAWLFVRQSISTARRLRQRNRLRALYQRTHPQHQPPVLPSRLLRKSTPTLPLRSIASLLSGKYAQQNTPLRSRREPVGHAVRFTYLQTAAALLARHTNDAQLLAELENAWEHMVTRRMYVSGGIGSLPIIEGFGRDYELHPELAYAETCAAIGSMLWSWEMSLATAQPAYAELFEWQLYNAASVSMAADGRAYFYDNPLASRGGLTRNAWYDVPCCPSNLSRVWSKLASFVFSHSGSHWYLQQYIPTRLELPGGVILRLESSLPWQGKSRLMVEHIGSMSARLHLRLPSWAGIARITVNNQPAAVELSPRPIYPPTACGYDPRRAVYLAIDRTWQTGDQVDIDFDLPVCLYRQDLRVAVCGGKVALGRGPLLYCLESIDNPGVDIFTATILPDSLQALYAPEVLGGVWMLEGKTPQGTSLRCIPYLLWGNRGQSAMNVFVTAPTG